MRLGLILTAFVAALSALPACSSSMQWAPSSPVLGRIASTGELVVGRAASMPPLNMTTKNGQVVGFEIDLAQAMAQAMNVKLRVAPIPFAELMPALEAGQVDMVLSGMTITPGRNMKVAFVGPY